MSTKAVFARRLNKLADYLETEVARAVKEKRVKWDMREWAAGEKKPKKGLNCGTAACAAGYATVIFPRSLCLIESTFGEDLWVLYEKDTNFSGFDACFSFFGTSVPFDYNRYHAMRPSLPTVVKAIRKAAREMSEEA